MARYIDADKVMGEIARIGGHNLCGWDTIGVKALIDRQPTADVVPKSEVEKLELTLEGVMWSVDKWLDEKDYDADPIKRAITMREKTLKIVENAKTEVARGIFAEIEQQLRGLFDFFRQDDCIRESSAITLAISEIAELKKKYTEGKT